MCHWCCLVCLIPAHWLLTLNRSLLRLFVSWYLFPALFANQVLICFMPAAHVSPVNFEQVTVSIRLFFTRVLCIYIILDKGCHILYVLGLNSTVCSHIIGVHLSSDQVTYDFMMGADFYNSFLLRLRIKSF